jgi:hypothetical protein
MRSATIGLVAWGAVLAGCGGGTMKPSNEHLSGEWLFVFPSGERATALSFKSDGTYSTTQIDVPTPTSRDQEVENGTYAATDTSITFTPTAWSCQGPDPVTTLPYAFVGGGLQITEPSGAVVFIVDTEPPLASSVTVQTGCFSANGAFTQSPVAAVTN